jgi:hypothetical protein
VYQGLEHVPNDSLGIGAESEEFPIIVQLSKVLMLLQTASKRSWSLECIVFFEMKTLTSVFPLAMEESGNF